MTSLKATAGLLFASAVLLAAPQAFAKEADGGGADARAIMAAKVSPVEAMKAAETKAGGTAVSLDFVGGASAYYQIEVVGADGVERQVGIDAASGEVVKAMASDDREPAGDDEGQASDTDGGDQEDGDQE